MAEASSAVVHPAQSACQWFQCQSNEGSALKDRVNPCWRMLPGLITLIGAIIGIVCSVLWNYPYLCIAFGPAVIASIYLIYLGWDYQYLKTFAENNAQLENSVTHLRTENAEYAEENKKLKTIRQELWVLAEAQKNEIGKLTDANARLKTTVDSLNKLQIILEQKAGKHVEHLAGLEQSLTGLEAATKEDHTTFAAHLATLKEQIDRIQQTRTSFEATSTDVERKMHEQIEILLKTSQLLQSVLSQINAWKDEKEVTRRIEQQQQLYEKLVDVQERLAHSSCKIAEQEKQIEELGKIKEGFNKTLATFIEEINSLQSVKGELSQEVAKVATAAKALHDYKPTK